MVFSSVEFLLYFLPVFCILYGITPGKYKNVTLLTGSLVFYGTGEPHFLVLLLCSVLVNYFIGLHLGVGRRKSRNNKNEKLHRKQRRLLALAIAGNVGLLVLFKTTSGKGGIPLGISFYTFQILSYLIDVYQGEVERETSFLRLSTYITMFPQLVSGPIVSYGEVREALIQRKTKTEDIQDGLRIFTLGLAGKVLLADRIGILWHEVQVTGFESISTPLAWMGAMAFSMKIYFDFYGYSLMAIGLGRMLGFELPENFRTPYMATSVRDFYRRWHITLGRWFCRYVYILMGGNRRGELQTILNLLAVWLLTAIWHGSTANFLIWGMLLWLLIVLERQMERIGVWQKLKVLPHLYLWAVIPVTWMCFAITDVSQLQIYLGRMFGVLEEVAVRASDWQEALKNYGGLFLVCFLCCTPMVKKIYRKWKDSAVLQLLLAVLFWACVWRLMIEGDNPFLYFRF